jgi:hypothetical protein
MIPYFIVFCHQKSAYHWIREEYEQAPKYEKVVYEFKIM